MHKWRDVAWRAIVSHRIDHALCVFVHVCVHIRSYVVIKMPLCDCWFWRIVSRATNRFGCVMHTVYCFIIIRITTFAMRLILILSSRTAGASRVHRGCIRVPKSIHCDLSPANTEAGQSLLTEHGRTTFDDISRFAQKNFQKRVSFPGDSSEM